jgi:hypothetical protein
VASSALAEPFGGLILVEGEPLADPEGPAPELVVGIDH